MFKSLSTKLTWGEVVYRTCAAYNFVMNEHSKESAFVLMFGSDAYIPLVQLLHPKIRYMVDSKSLLALDALRDIHVLVIHNVKLLRERQENQFPTYPGSEFHVGDKLLVRSHVMDVWDPMYYVAYHVVCVCGINRQKY